MKNDAVRIEKITKITPAEIKSVFTTLPVIDPFITALMRYHARWNWRGLFNPIDHCTVPQSIQRGILNCSLHGNVALKLYQRKFFSFATFQSGSFFINRCHTWSTYGFWRKIRSQNVDEKTSVSNMFPCNSQIWNVTPHTSADFLVFETCVYSANRYT